MYKHYENDKERKVEIKGMEKFIPKDDGLYSKFETSDGIFYKLTCDLEKDFEQYAKVIRNQAIKEFAERLKCCFNNGGMYGYATVSISMKINKLVEEMTK